MSALRAWMWKEGREHAVGLAALVASIAALTALPFLLFPESLRYDHLQAFPALAVAIAAVTVGAGLFGREARSGALALMLRTPGSMRAALAVKSILWLVAVALALAAEEAVRISISRATGIPLREIRSLGPDGSVRVSPRQFVPIDVSGLRGGAFPLVVTLAFAPWVLAGSAATRGGARALLGVLLLALLGAPLLFLVARHPWWVALGPGDAIAVASALAAVAGAALVAAWLHGRRVVLGRMQPLLVAAAVGALPLAIATIAVADSISRWEAPDASAPEFRIDAAWLGEGGRFLYMNTGRGERFSANFGHVTSERGSPTRTWVIDLERGDEQVAPMDASGFFAPNVHVDLLVIRRAAQPVPWVERWEASPGQHEETRTAWIDARNNERRFVTQARGNTDAARQAIRDVARATTHLRDAKGRRVWWFDGALEREREPGSSAVEVVATFDDAGWANELWDGIEVHAAYRPSSPRRTSPVAPPVWRYVTVDGTSTPLWPTDRLDEPTGQHSASWTEVRVDDRHVLRSTSHQDVEDYLPERATAFANADLSPGRWTWDGWALEDLQARTRTRVDDLDELEELTSIAPGVLLRIAAAEAGEPAASRHGLVLWRPLDKERSVESVVSGDAMGTAVRSFDSYGAVGDGRLLLAVWDEPRADFLSRSGRQAILLFDHASKRVECLTSWSSARLQPVAVEPDGALVAIEEGRRIVRFRDHGKERMVLFPKPK